MATVFPLAIPIVIVVWTLVLTQRQNNNDHLKCR